MSLLQNFRRRPRTLGDATDRDLFVEAVVATAGVTLFLLYTLFIFFPAWRGLAAYLGP